jgi:alkylation response protein AidB-like acyl-CoA dehydrogenase
MDVTIPEIPQAYDEYRNQLRSFISDRLPSLESSPKVGARMPQSDGDLATLRIWVAALHDAGYVCARFAEDQRDPFELRIMEQELAATGIPYVLGNPLVSGALKAFGTADQRATYLPAMARGDQIWTQLFSEPNAGSDLTSLQTSGRRDGDDWIIKGQKVWSTWAPYADFGYLLARTEPDSGSRGISAFILDMRSEGVDIRPLREMTGTADFSEVFLDDVRVPARNMIGAPGEGWTVANVSLAAERGGVGELGSSDVVRGLMRLATTGRRGGQPLDENSDVRQTIAAFAARSRIQDYLGYKVATRTMRSEMALWDAPIMKVWVSELNLESVEYGLSLQGARSVLSEHDPLVIDGGYWQDSFLYARALTIAGGSNEVMRNMIAERGLGLPRESRPG